MNWEVRRNGPKDWPKCGYVFSSTKEGRTCTSFLDDRDMTTRFTERMARMLNEHEKAHERWNQ